MNRKDAEAQSSGGENRLSDAAIFLVGPTASGKSAVALALAEQVGGEIISVDSMQVYRGLDIGTAKPSAEERSRVSHHLIDIVDLKEPFDAAKFVDHARRAEHEIVARGRVPIFCGGTGLYLKAYFDGLGEAPSADLALRAQLEALPLDVLLQELAAADPVTYDRIDRKNPRRVVRAVEVIRVTGRPFSAQRADWSKDVMGNAGRRIIGIQREPADLRSRIDSRVDDMFARGLVDETRALLEQGLAENATAMQAIGYRQVVEHLRGEHSLADTIELVKTKTRQFAKRQMTWFRRQLPVEWIPASADTPVDTLCRQILDRCRAV